MLSTMTRAMPQITLPDGESMPAYGQGTWHMGENRDSRADETAALRLGIDLGITLIDTAEMYANGVAEEIVADAMGQDREKLFIVSKVLPSNASQQGTIEACERSLRRLRTDRIDLYLLHWRAAHPFVETLAGFERLQRDGKIRHHGVSNFGRRDMAKWVSAGGANIVANQILYNLNRRDPEWGVIPWCHDRRISIMAYSPIEQGRMLGHKALAEVAGRHGAKPAQVALAWLLRQDGLIVIPKASQQQHVRENLGALDLTLTDDDLVTLDRAFPRPGRVSARQGLSYIYHRPALASVRTWITDMIRRPRRPH
jgi:diketogulonate reductase-like aldo/keto reductase